MTKSNRKQNPSATSTVVETTSVVEQPANETAEHPEERYDLSGNSDVELNELLSACLAELKVRKEAAYNLLPQVGATVEIHSGKWKGKKGVIVQRAKTRCHVQVADMPVTAYVLMSECSVVAAA